MARDIRSLSKRARLGYGIGCLALGCYPIAIAFGPLAVESAELLAPRWVVAGAGLTFLIAGCMILLANHARANDMLAGLLLLLFGVLGMWVAVFSSDKGFSGGLPFVPQETNILVGRWLFGLGALICFAFSAYAFRRAVANRNAGN